MAQGTMNSKEMQRNFMYLFERMTEPLAVGFKGTINDMVRYNLPQGESNPFGPVSASGMSGGRNVTMVSVRTPLDMPMAELKLIGSMCPRSGLFGYFLPQHREAVHRLKTILMKQKSVEDLFNMACFCRDSPMINSHLFVQALAGALAGRSETKDFGMPATYEVMPDLFLTDNVIKQAEKMARMPDKMKKMIIVDRNSTGHQSDPESRLWYFREDLGVNSHHFHWHIVFPGQYTSSMEKKRDRRGELFYYMHHSMVCRYDAERLSNGLARTKLFNFDNLTIEEGYFGKLYSVNGQRHWGTRQANTKLTNVLRFDPVNQFFFDLRIEDLKKWRDRISEAIDTGYIIQRSTAAGDQRIRLDEKTGIDVLGDLLENSQDSPHAQFYGPDGFHNMGHVVLAFSHDPLGKYNEHFSPMGDTATAMRDPLFYRWHKYLDNQFDQYKKTLAAYQLSQGTWPLVWNSVNVDSIEVLNSNEAYKQRKNFLSTHWMQTDIDLARGLDFWRTSADSMDPVWARVTHLNYDPFIYSLNISNLAGMPVEATIRIFMAPRLNEHGDQFDMASQRLLFFELDKFTKKLQPGVNKISRSSVESSVTIKTENSFRQLENLNKETHRNDFRSMEGRCGCGWPQHLLLPRGTPVGMAFDLFVMVTDGTQDTKRIKNQNSCREALSFCGVLNEEFPDARPMGYPFDRLPYSEPGATNPVTNLEAYVKNIPNAAAITVTIIHEPNTVKTAPNGAPSTMEMVNEQSQPVKPPTNRPVPDLPPPTSRPHNQQMLGINQNSVTGDRGGKNLPTKGKGNVNKGNFPLDYQNQWGGLSRYGRENEEESVEDWDYLDA